MFSSVYRYKWGMKGMRDLSKFEFSRKWFLRCCFLIWWNLFRGLRIYYIPTLSARYLSVEYTRWLKSLRFRQNEMQDKVLSLCLSKWIHFFGNDDGGVRFFCLVSRLRPLARRPFPVGRLLAPCFSCCGCGIVSFVSSCLFVLFLVLLPSLVWPALQQHAVLLAEFA